MGSPVLVISYMYSTERGVGGRRWIKYSRELAERGYEVIVLCERSELSASEKHPKIKYVTFRSKYPKVLDASPQSIYAKIRYRLSLLGQKISTVGTPYDKVARNEKELILKIKELIIKHSIKNLIVTGAPFSLLYLGAQIKKEFQSINLICDYRDAWTTGHGYGMRIISKKRFGEEERRELVVLGEADKVLVASDDIRKQLTAKYPTCQNKIHVLMNGIEYKEVKNLKNKNDSKILHIVHVGNVNSGTKKYWKLFIEFVRSGKVSVNLSFFGLQNKELINYIQSLKPKKISIHPRLEEQDLQKHLSDADVFLLFKKDSFEDSFPSKFFDYIRYRKPIVAFTRKGKVSEEISENRIGKVFNESTTENEFLDFFSALKNNTFEFNSIYNWKKFSIEEQVEQLIKYLN